MIQFFLNSDIIFPWIFFNFLNKKYKLFLNLLIDFYSTIYFYQFEKKNYFREEIRYR